MDNLGDEIVAKFGYATIIIGAIFIILFFIMWIKEQIKEKPGLETFLSQEMLGVLLVLILILLSQQDSRR